MSVICLVTASVLQVKFPVKGTSKQNVNREVAPSTAANKAKEELYSQCYNDLVTCARSIALDLGMNWKNIYR